MCTYYVKLVHIYIRYVSNIMLANNVGTYLYTLRVLYNVTQLLYYNTYLIFLYLIHYNTLSTIV